MTDLPDWAQDRAREWLEPRIGPSFKMGFEEDKQHVASLAALLVEVAAVGEMVRAEDAEYLSTLRADVLAEVRRVVEEVLADHWPASVFTPPPKGQHGSTVDACSAAADMRAGSVRAQRFDQRRSFFRKRGPVVKYITPDYESGVSGLKSLRGLHPPVAQWKSASVLTRWPPVRVRPGGPR